MERKDIWTENNDVILAETVLKHISSGSTQLKAFDEVGETLNRTSAACGFRWNSEVRKRYEKEISDAKKMRVSRTNGDKIETENDSSSAQNLINNLNKVFSGMEKEIERLRNEIKFKDQEIERLKNQSPEMTINEDYKEFLKILQNARTLGVFEKDNRKEVV